MLTCPYCGCENMDGADECERCNQSLTFLSKPRGHTAIEKAIFRDRIDVLKPREHPQVGSETPVGRVLELLVEKRVGCALVVDGDALVGVFSERDALLRLNTEATALSDRPIRQFMTPSPVTLQITDKIAFALHRMALGGYRHIPVMSDGRLIGVISVRDILGYITEKLTAQT